VPILPVAPPIISGFVYSVDLSNKFELFFSVNMIGVRASGFDKVLHSGSVPTAAMWRPNSSVTTCRHNIVKFDPKPHSTIDLAGGTLE
jgi:hypothetical protein